MNMYEWAEQECRIACKKKNPDFDFDSKEFDYDCACYKSALKAYKSLCEDDHSGHSFNATKNILIRLLEGQPLTPITDKDFFSVECGTHPLEAPEDLKKRGLKSDVQCPRMYSLFRLEGLDGTVKYCDVDRAYYIDVEDPSDTYGSGTNFLDEMFPITVPYMPQKGKYKIYVQSFLTDRAHGDFDTEGILYVITPDGKKVDINTYRTEGDDGKWCDITKEEYDKLLAKRIDPLNEKVAGKLLWTLISNSSNEAEIKRREQAYELVSKEVKAKWSEDLKLLCKFFNDPDHYKYNSFSIRQALCTGDREVYKDVPELVEIAEYLGAILKEIGGNRN